MIDYEKLQQAHELAKKYYEQTSYPVVIESNYSAGCRQEPCKLWINNVAEPFSDLDDLILVLFHRVQTKPKPKPKYEIGQHVFILMDNWDIGQGIIDRHDKDYQIKFKSGKFKVYEECFLFATEQELIQSQIDYWTCRQNEEISTHSEDMSKQSTCDHDWDTSQILCSLPPQYKCLKCHGFSGDISLLK